MNTADLGPMEQAILRALASAEAVGVQALDTESLWRLLPGYSTHLANVDAALADASALGRFVTTDGTRWALVDRPDALAAAQQATERAAAVWVDTSSTLRGLAKLPWIEGLAVAGAWALGQSPSPGAAIDIALLAEGHRGRAAQAAFVASLRSRGPAAQHIRLVVVFDADAAMQLDDAERLQLATLQPITHPAAWDWLRARDTGLSDAFPNAPWSDARLPYGLADRLDGRLAVLRRRLLAGDEEVTTAQTRHGGRRLQLDRLFGGLVRRLAGDATLHPPERGDVDARWADVQGWTFDEPVPVPAAGDPVGPAIDPRAHKTSDPTPTSTLRTVPTSRRTRGAQKRPRRTAGAAVSATGRRGGRRKAADSSQ